MQSIEGTWNSRYEYARGPGGEQQVSEHSIRFAQMKSEWVGVSLPVADGSEVRLNLRQEGNQFSGTWHEKTSPAGHYKGREFSGAILLSLNESGQELSGKWLGMSSSTNRIKDGAWTLRRNQL
jgi:hypothetical protein